MRILNLNDKNIMLYNDDVIENTNDIADLMVKAISECNAHLIALDSTKLDSKFFDLNFNLLDELLQKLKFFGVKIALFGDFSIYDLKNTKKHVAEKNYLEILFFVESKQDAIKILQQK